MNTEQLRESKILVTGASGFLGKHLCRHLTVDLECNVYEAGLNGKPGFHGHSVSGFDLTDPGEAEALLGSRMYDYVFHLAGFNGGIQFNLDNPADIFMRNTLMGMNVLNAAKENGVKKVVSVVASCAYPEDPCHTIWGIDQPGIMFEEHFIDGPPHHSVACHGYAKRNLQLASSFMRKQYGLNAVCVCPTTLYGPGDSYDPQRTKVMGGMVKRFVDAADKREQEVVCWGTGRPMREFLYAEDCAKLLVASLLKYDDSDAPLNLGTGQELSVRQVAETVAAAVGYSGKIRWDTSKADGQFRKRLDLTRMKAVLGDFAPTPLVEGIRKTAEDYRARRDKGAA